MNSLAWLIDKIIDIIAPRLYLRIKDKWKENPRLAFAILAVLASLLIPFSSLAKTVLYMPILFLDDDRPLRLSSVSRASNELDHTNESLITEAGIFVDAEPNKTNSRDFDSWSYAGILVALGPDLVSSRLKQDHALYFRKWMKQKKNCWAEYGKEEGPCHVGATSWVLVAMSTNAIKPTKEMWTYLLEQQNKLGWWPLYEDSGNDPQNASTYSTAVALWAVQTGLNSNAIPESLIATSKVSLERARSWLFAKRNKGGCLWSAYPDRVSTVEPSLAISGFVVNSLLHSRPELIENIRDECLHALTSEEPAITELYTSGESVNLNDGKTTEKDAVRHQKLIMAILALDRLYPMLTITDKSRVRRFVESTLFPDRTPIEPRLDYSWQKAELALMLKAILNQ
jgi:hypothetical protein